MTEQLDTSNPVDTTAATAAHLEAVRNRGRWMMASEGAADQSYEVLHASAAARDGAILMLALGMVLHAAGLREHMAAILFAAAVSFALYTGIANMLAIAAQLRFWQREVQRERNEIRHEPEQERDEIRVLYEAKGFSGPMLEQILDTLCSDEDRLLKVMLEEELGIFMEQANHPVIMGVLTGVASLVGGMVVAASVAAGPMWLPICAVAALLVVVAYFRTGMVGRPAVESFARWAVTAGTLAGVAYFLGSLARG